MRILERRLRKLEDQLGPTDGKRRRFRMLLTIVGQPVCLESAKVTRTLWANGTVFEMVDWLPGVRSGLAAIGSINCGQDRDQYRTSS